MFKYFNKTNEIDKNKISISFRTKPRRCNDVAGIIFAVGGQNKSGNSLSTVEVRTYIIQFNKFLRNTNLVTNLRVISQVLLLNMKFSLDLSTKIYLRFSPKNHCSRKKYANPSGQQLFCSKKYRFNILNSPLFTGLGYPKSYFVS